MQSTGVSGIFSNRNMRLQRNLKMNAPENIDALQVQQQAELEISRLIDRSRTAQQQITEYTQQQVDELITAMVYAVARDDRAEQIARFTVEETQLGNYQGKYLKIHRKTRAALMDIIAAARSWSSFA